MTTLAAVASPAISTFRRDPRALVVDDNRDSADTLCALLSLLGVQAIPAYDGPSALEIFARQHPPLVLLDLEMPWMSGFEVARRIRATPSVATTLVAVTGFDPRHARDRVRSAGFDHHMVKPFEYEDIVALLEKA